MTEIDPTIVARRRRARRQIELYVAIARPDHWVKNAFMVLGVVLAYFYHPQPLQLDSILTIAWAVAACCFLASSNYVLNEILDASNDVLHPVKRDRPLASGRIVVAAAWVEWLLLALIGLAMAAAINRPFLVSGISLLLMGLVYNVPPVRSKELPFVDVLSESVNNPIRLLLGWFAVTTIDFPPMSLLISYWMVGAFLMASKRFAEYRSIADPRTAAAYRHSFRYYTEESLLVSMVFYTTTFGLFFGIFIVRYHLELILLVPFISGFVTYYLHIAFKRDSAAQSPERLYRETGLMIFISMFLVAFFVLMFVHIPVLYRWFNVQPSPISPLWKF